MLQPQFVVHTAVLLDSLAGFTSDDENSGPNTPGTSMECYASTKDLSAFVRRFPVSLDGQPPRKKPRVNEGFLEDRIFYDRWRNSQYAKREEYLLSHFMHRKPTAAKVARLIAQEGWKGNSPKPEEIERLWKPATKIIIETDEISQQTWKGLALKDFGAQQSLGVVATRHFSKRQQPVYHGKVLTAAAGRAMMQKIHDKAGYLFFFKAGQRDLCN